MKRRTLDIVFSIGSVFLVVVVLVMGFELQRQTKSATNSVSTQLTQQRITFKPEAKLSAKQKTEPCLVQNAGKPLTTAVQAECYADQQIRGAMLAVNKGRSYTQTSKAAASLKYYASVATKEHASNAASLEIRYTAMEAKASTLYQDQTERNLLLSIYELSNVSKRAHEAALACFLVALILFLAAIASAVRFFSRADRSTSWPSPPAGRLPPPAPTSGPQAYEVVSAPRMSEPPRPSPVGSLDPWAEISEQG